MLPFLSRTVASTVTTLTLEEKVGAGVSCWATNGKLASTTEITTSRWSRTRRRTRMIESTFNSNTVTAAKLSKFGQRDILELSATKGSKRRNANKSWSPKGVICVSRERTPAVQRTGIKPAAKRRQPCELWPSFDFGAKSACVRSG